MADQLNQVVVYCCPNCTTGAHESGKCAVCGAERVECDVGSAEGPLRRPLMSKSGEVVTHAPRWWLHNRLGWLVEAAEKLRT